ncbi:DUF5110 domain-containing protein [Algoriphagus boritolerans]|uniref:DUF5110 domain-containing protein n=1 Tax=Algoriphagus boritolerans TaxID=308111 RepID=UPI000A9CF7FA
MIGITFSQIKKHSGKEVIYQDCPLNYLPVYVKGGQLFALQSDVNSASEQTDGILRIHVYKGKTGSEYLHYEDAGEGLGYLAGEYLKRTISYNPESETLEFGNVEGLYQSNFDRLKVYFHGFTLDSVSIDEERYPLKTEAYAFLGKLTEFDPLPENDHPYFEINNLPYLDLDHLSSAFVIKGIV